MTDSEDDVALSEVKKQKHHKSSLDEGARWLLKRAFGSDVSSPEESDLNETKSSPRNVTESDSSPVKIRKPAAKKARIMLSDEQETNGENRNAKQKKFVKKKPSNSQGQRNALGTVETKTKKADNSDSDSDECLANFREKTPPKRKKKPVSAEDEDSSDSYAKGEITTMPKRMVSTSESSDSDDECLAKLSSKGSVKKKGKPALKKEEEKESSAEELTKVRPNAKNHKSGSDSDEEWLTDVLEKAPIKKKYSKKLVVRNEEIDSAPPKINQEKPKAKAKRKNMPKSAVKQASKESNAERKSDSDDDKPLSAVKCRISSDQEPKAEKKNSENDDNEKTNESETSSSPSEDDSNSDEKDPMKRSEDRTDPESDVDPVKNTDRNSDSDSGPDDRNPVGGNFKKSLKLSSPTKTPKTVEKVEKKTKQKNTKEEESKSSATVRLENLKRMVLAAGFRFNYKKLFADIDTDKKRSAKIEQAMREKGYTGIFTLESCRRFKLKREEDAELAALSNNIIFDNESGNRVTRSSRSTATVIKKQVVLSSSDDEDEEDKPAQTANIFQNLAGIVDDEADSD